MDVVKPLAAPPRLAPGPVGLVDGAGPGAERLAAMLAGLLGRDVARVRSAANEALAELTRIEAAVVVVSASAQALARTLLAGATCPVAIAPATAGAPEDGPVLVPLDGTAEAASAVPTADWLAERLQAPRVFLHVAGPTPPGAFSVPRLIDQPQHEWPAWRREFLDRFCHCGDQTPPELDVTAGDPVEAIARVARDRRARLIVAAWRGEWDEGRARTLGRLAASPPVPLFVVRTSP